MTWAVAICLLARLAAGGPLAPGRLATACSMLEQEARLSLSVGDTASWTSRWVHWDEWEETPTGLIWSCETMNLLVREGATGCELLARPSDPDSSSAFYVMAAGFDFMVHPLDSVPKGAVPSVVRQAWVTHRLLPLRICTDARRRVLARELYSLLPAGMRCGS